MVQKGVGLRMVAYEWQRKEIVDHQISEVREVRYLPKDSQMPANTEIHEDGVFLQIYTDPLILIEIRSKDVAEGYRQQFEALWEIGKK